jgi:hypothetical protein
VTDVLNGVDTEPLTGWVIVLAHGQTMIGKDVGGGLLKPVYGLTCAMQMVQRSPQEPPQLMTVRRAMPFLTFASIDEVCVQEDAIFVPCKLLSRSERRELARSIEACDRLMDAMRAQEAGIVLAPAGARLPG